MGRAVCDVAVELKVDAELADFVVSIDYREATTASGRRRTRVDAECSSAVQGPAVDLGAVRNRTTLTVSGSLTQPGPVVAGELFRCRFAFDDPAWLPTSADFDVSAVETRYAEAGPSLLALPIAVGEVTCGVSVSTTTLPTAGGLIVAPTTSTSSTSTTQWPSTTSSTSTTLFAPTTTVPVTMSCGDPTGGGPSAADALFVLGVVVRTQACADCICDVDGSGAVTATDALILLRLATGQAIGLVCPACGF